MQKKFLSICVGIFFIYLLNLSFLFAHYDLSICTIFKNEAPFLKEWIEFHKIQGVQHFFLYSNNSTDNYKKVLKPYIDDGKVTLIEWNFDYTPGISKGWLDIQKGAYNDCLNTFGQETQWLAIIDTDEFLFCPTGTQLTDFLADYQQYGGLCVNWLFFGTSHVKDIPKGKVMIELLTCCAKSPYQRDCYVKSIVQPKYVKASITAHTCKYIEGIYPVTEDGLGIVRTIEAQNIRLDRIRINHYWTRTEKYFEEKKIESKHNRRSFESPEALRNRAKGYNIAVDKAILQFVPALRKAMGYK